MATNKDNPDGAKIEAAKPQEKPKKAAGAKKAAAPKTPAPSRKNDPTDIGIDVKAPAKTCTDRDCPFHGTLPVRGQILEGDIVSTKMQKTAVVKKLYMRKNRKYERLEKRSSKYIVHNPPCMEVKVGDHVKIMECRPLSKLVSFVIIEKMNQG
jgi:small subunit ribosomal protein S17